MQFNNPIQILDLEKGQNPPKKISLEKKEVQARGSRTIKHIKSDKSWPNKERDKKNTPEPKKTTHGNCEPFQNYNHPVLEVYLPVTKMNKPEVNTETSQEAATTTTSTNRKKVTTIFPRKKEVKKVIIQPEVTINITTTKNMPEEPSKVEEANSSDEDILEAALALERDEERKAKKEAESQGAKDKVTTSMDDLSDEELLQAAMELESLQLANYKVDKDGAHQEGPHQEGDQLGHPQHEEEAMEARQNPNRNLSLRMMTSHSTGTQEWKDVDLNQAGHEQGDHPVGGDHSHVCDIGAEGDHQEGATGVTGCPSSPTLPTRSQTTPPGSPMTPGTSRARVNVTPLWKRKSLVRKLSSSKEKIKSKRLSQQRSPSSTPSQASASKHTITSITTTKYRMSPTQEKAGPGPKFPPIFPISKPTLYPQELPASTSGRPTDVAGNLANTRLEISAWKE